MVYHIDVHLIYYMIWYNIIVYYTERERETMYISMQYVRICVSEISWKIGVSLMGYHWCNQQEPGFYHDVWASDHWFTNVLDSRAFLNPILGLWVPSHFKFHWWLAGSGAYMAILVDDWQSDKTQVLRWNPTWGCGWHPLGFFQRPEGHDTWPSGPSADLFTLTQEKHTHQLAITPVESYFTSGTVVASHNSKHSQIP